MRWLFFLSACQPSTPAATFAAPNPTPLGVPSPVTIGDWVPCAAVSGVDEDGAECAIATLPLDHDAPEGDTIEVLVKRLPAAGEEGGQVWALHGGPGASAVDDLVGLMAGLPVARPDLGFYAIDHRGIGGSERLSCPDQEAPTSAGGVGIGPDEWEGCIAHLGSEWGDDLQHISTTASARDIGSLIAALAEDDAEVFLYGGSYGTWLAQRAMHLFPDRLDGVILDGIQPADQSFVDYPRRMNDVGHALMDVCAENPECAGHFDGDPWQTAVDTVAALDGGHCPALGMSGDEARLVLGYLTLYQPLRDLVPATVHRLDRCTLDDAEAILGLVTGLFGLVDPGGNDGVGRSNVLGVHISVSELWLPFDPPQLETVEAEYETFTMALGQNADFARVASAWPAFAPDRYHGILPPFDGPLLMLNGALDPATTLDLAEPLREVYDGPGQTFVTFPWGAHGMLVGTPMPEGPPCGERITLDFLADPHGEPDLSCVAATSPPDFDGDPLYAEFLFGSVDVWGD